MSKKKAEQTATPSKARKAKPETVFKRTVEKKFKAWLMLQSMDVNLSNNTHLLEAFSAGARMGHNGAFKTE